MVVALSNCLPIYNVLLWILGKSINKIFSHKTIIFTMIFWYMIPWGLWSVKLEINRLTSVKSLLFIYFSCSHQPPPPNGVGLFLSFQCGFNAKVENNMPHRVLTRRNNLHNIKGSKNFFVQTFPLHFFLTSQTRGRGHYPTSEIREQNFHPGSP